MEIDPATVILLDLPACIVTASEIVGHIQYIDHFGNLITTIRATYIKDRQWSVTAGGKSIPGHKTYGDTNTGSLLALEGSHGFIEIAAHDGSAQAELKIGYRSQVRVVITQ